MLGVEVRGEYRGKVVGGSRLMVDPRHEEHADYGAKDEYV